MQKLITLGKFPALFFSPSLLQGEKITLGKILALFFPPIKGMRNSITHNTRDNASRLSYHALLKFSSLLQRKKITLGKFPALFFAFWNPQVSSTSSNVAQLM
jgi:hypothetical protein